MRLIDADKLFEQVEELYKSAKTPERQAYSHVLDIISAAQEVEPVIRCRRCEYARQTLDKRAKRCDRERPISEMLLMMFRSANRDRYKKQNNEKVNNLTKCYDTYNIKIQEGDILYGMSNSSYCDIKGVVTYESSEKCFVLLNRDELYYLNPKMCRHFEIMGNKTNNPDMIGDLFESSDY